MAGTYYGYVERTAGDQVNWAQIGLDITDMISKESARREELKAEIDKNSRAFGEILSNAPTGENESLNRWAMDYADSAQQARLLQDRLLKSGTMKLKDYNMMRQNLNDGTSSAFGLLKEYQSEYANRMERWNKDESHALEVWQLSMLEGLGKFNETGLYINPTDYSVFVAKKSYNKKTGVYEMSNNPDEYKSVTQLRGLLKSKIDRFKTEDVLQAEVNRLGEYMYAQAGKTGYETISDAMKSPYFKDAQQKFIDKIVNDDFNSSSVLLSDLLINPDTGSAYDFTSNKKEADADPSKVYLDTDPSTGRMIPKLTETQKKGVRDYLTARMNAMIDRKMSVSVYPQKQESAEEIKARGRGKEEADSVTKIAELYYGTGEEINSALDYFKGLDPNIAKLDRNPKGVTVIYNDGRQVNLDFFTPDGKKLNLQQWVEKSTELTKVKNVKDAMDRARIAPNATLNEETKSSVKTGKIAPQFEEAITIKDIKSGKEIPMTMATIQGRLQDENTAQAAVNIATELFKDISPNAEVSYSSVGWWSGLWGSNEVANIKLPNVMDWTLVIPSSLAGENLAPILRLLYDSAMNKQPVTREAVRSLFGKTEIFDEYNKATSFAEF